MAENVPSRRALIVDDEFLIAFDVEASMHELGFDICTVASNERDAIQLAKSNPPDVVVMDVYLNGTRSGIEAARWLREVCGVPVVFMTAQIDKSTLDRIRTVMPGAPVLSKPVSGLTAIQRLLKHRIECLPGRSVMLTSRSAGLPASSMGNGDSLPI